MPYCSGSPGLPRPIAGYADIGRWHRRCTLAYAAAHSPGAGSRCDCRSSSRQRRRRGRPCGLPCRSSRPGRTWWFLGLRGPGWANQRSRDGASDLGRLRATATETCRPAGAGRWCCLIIVCSWRCSFLGYSLCACCCVAAKTPPPLVVAGSATQHLCPCLSWSGAGRGTCARRDSNP